METVFNKVNSVFNINFESGKYKINGTAILHDKIENLQVTVESDEYLGNVNYQEFGDNNNSLNSNIKVTEMIYILPLMETIIKDCRELCQE